MNCKQEKVYEITEKTPLKFEVKEPGTDELRNIFGSIYNKVKI